MPYPADRTHLSALIEKAMNTEEIQDSLKKIPVDYNTLRETVMKNADQVWEAAAKQISEYDLLEIRLEKKYKSMPAIFRLLSIIYRSLISVFTSSKEIDPIAKNMEIARKRTDEALVRYGIIPQLRSILNKEFWESWRK